MIVGVGVDIIEVHRIEDALSRHGERFLQRMFTPGEIEYCVTSREQSARRLAARFAAKEAALKALGTGLREVRWTDCEVVKNPLGRPELQLHGRLAEVARDQGVTAFHLSLSHCKEYALAQVVAVR